VDVDAVEEAIMAEVVADAVAEIVVAMEVAVVAETEEGSLAVDEEEVTVADTVATLPLLLCSGYSPLCPAFIHTDALLSLATPTRHFNPPIPRWPITKIRT